MKLIFYGMRIYLKNLWNKLDFLIALISAIDILFSYYLTSIIGENKTAMLII